MNNEKFPILSRLEIVVVGAYLWEILWEKNGNFYCSIIYAYNALLNPTFHAVLFSISVLKMFLNHFLFFFFVLSEFFFVQGRSKILYSVIQCDFLSDITAYSLYAVHSANVAAIPHTYV